MGYILLYNIHTFFEIIYCLKEIFSNIIKKNTLYTIYIIVWLIGCTLYVYIFLCSTIVCMRGIHFWLTYLHYLTIYMFILFSYYTFICQTPYYIIYLLMVTWISISIMIEIYIITEHSWQNWLSHFTKNKRYLFNFNLNRQKENITYSWNHKKIKLGLVKI